jgi:hypothetical protein
VPSSARRRSWASWSRSSLSATSALSTSLSARILTPMRLATCSCHVCSWYVYLSSLGYLNFEILEYHYANRPTKNPPRRSGERRSLKVSLLIVLLTFWVIISLEFRAQIYNVLPPFQIIDRFGFARCIDFAMHYFKFFFCYAPRYTLCLDT